jgi:VanZ family protein
MKGILKYYGPAILWALFIFIMCSIKTSKLPPIFPGFDKLTHCGLLFVLVVFGCTGRIGQRSPAFPSYFPVIIITVLAVMYGGLIELLQLWFFTWRSAEWNDLFADFVGASMGAFSVMLTIKSMSYVKT